MIVCCSLQGTEACRYSCVLCSLCAMVLAAHSVRAAGASESAAYQQQLIHVYTLHTCSLQRQQQQRKLRRLQSLRGCSNSCSAAPKVGVTTHRCVVYSIWMQHICCIVAMIFVSLQSLSLQQWCCHLSNQWRSGGGATWRLVHQLYGKEGRPGYCQWAQYCNCIQ